MLAPLTSALPGGISPTWSGTFQADTPGLTVNWQWGAAVYTQFSSDNNALGVKPVDGSLLSVYHNSDHAGAPESFRSAVTAGARGSGGTNYTGTPSSRPQRQFCRATKQLTATNNQRPAASMREAPALMW